MRSFLALPLPDPVAAALTWLQAGLPFGRPVPQPNLHLTLAFLGDQPEARLIALDEALRELDAPAVPLEITGLGSFGGDRPRLLFADVAPVPELLALHRAIRGALRLAAMPAPKERFHPHITLFRFGAGLRPQLAERLPALLADHPLPDLPAATLDRVGLYRSSLRPEGARYDLLADYPLAPAAGLSPPG
ncbi:RNA 2',3'-cyclic phosphodiesterase [Pseudodonghicola flavimaris]|uniref:RNA 2',3'-cyclic phosphodiesterase n=1 Tax=Pseudodonghicola flavimaris TaxID=3050036 RepID=A0ABT7EYC4_9RHOB|nr:RNA 2',3'-cyclic phosphodiesterase [Pseudodonghicola flavimaris]MDK3017353.1 RNA 2',3'-cyclic phosphodiesterase [Pseudodonghicola flavimaris]